MAKPFKQFISEKNFYLDVDNEWDSKQKASNENEAVKQLFPRAKEIKVVGADDDERGDSLVFSVKDYDGEILTVKVYQR